MNWHCFEAPPPKKTRYLVYGKEVGWTFATYKGDGLWLYGQVVMNTWQMQDHFTHWANVVPPRN
jgi:hypothetical protein